MNDGSFEKEMLVVLGEIRDEMRALGDPSLRAPKCGNCEVAMDPCERPDGAVGCKWHLCPICQRYAYKGTSGWVRGRDVNLRQAVVTRRPSNG